MYRLLLYSFLILPVTASAGTTIYTDSHQRPMNPPAGVRVVLLDAPEQTQDTFFGVLPAEPAEASARVMERMQSPEWQSFQAGLAEHYRALAHAWSLGLKKYPAVVFDDSEVVYGTTDVVLAEQLRTGGGQP
ncbi:TIGR03757 family integrating conjugative element protein [Escherichia coli]|uniref:TIGR03757 family integrating conjugative element protein n=1 Tax=Escherichia coli TaxID=562 RepID=UPI0007A63B98|nr:TIGR03757 family integrating conjugative element protein [Escherichia coli]EEQ8053747.1 TIGR03757 family integrating conjugative element protein [Escherichia coli]EES5229607.1 TIGR03757 family integrating conjugative element protein [Escherichia coli]EES7191247.1 TIGR03757 family integrating conjugative element protein [Escherichia coli]EEZ3296670.1 TIGR03757 family integrating conjugative element protein [Escherichia coli]EJR5666632.1 TIGR03757 family integrating conjugative element protei